MADMRLKISDGTTTLDLFSGTDSIVRIGGLEMPPPKVNAEYVASPYADGARLAASRYENRTITIHCKIIGTSLADLQTNIRTIQRILNDARERVLLGYGTKYYLEYQWGDTANQSVFFDILRGDLVLPNDYFSALLRYKYYILDAQIVLTCKPFGRYTNQTIGTQTIYNGQNAYLLRESLTSGDDAHFTIDSANDWACQTFRATSSSSRPYVAMKAYRAGTPGTITFEIYEVDGADKPTGAARATGTVDGDLLDTENPEFIIAAMSAYSLSMSTNYALVMRCPGADAANKVFVRYIAAGGYAQGQFGYSADGGTSWTMDAAKDFLFGAYYAYSGGAEDNFQDITTSASYGDLPAKLYIKLELDKATGTKKMWIAKRSGSRQTDDLWLHGEDAATVTNIIGGAHSITNFKALYDGGSNDMSHVVDIYPTGGNIAAASEVARLNYTISTVPRGHFRVLAKAKIECDTPADYDHIGFGFGWSYGDRTRAPSDASGQYFTLAAEGTYEILDLGDIILPPIAESEIASNNSLELRLYLYSKDVLTQSEFYMVYIDYIFLLPIDEGVCIIDDVVSTDIIIIDGISDPPIVAQISGTAIQDLYNFRGTPFTMGRESTRIYVLRDDVNTAVVYSNITYQPQFMVV